MPALHRITLIAAIMVLALFTACRPSAEQEKIQLAADQMQAQLPIDLGMGITLEKVEYDSGERLLTLRYTSDESTVHVDGLTKVRNAQRRFLTTFMASEGTDFLHTLADAGASIEFQYYGRRTHINSSILFSPDELLEISMASDTVSDRRQQLDDLVAITNAQCPMQFDGDDMILRGAQCTQRFIIFDIAYNPGKYDLRGHFDQFRSSLVQGARDELSQNGSELQSDLMKALGVGYRYIFAPADTVAADTITIDLPASELFD